MMYYLLGVRGFFFTVFSDQVNGGVATSGAYQLTSPTGHGVLVSPNLVQPNPPPPPARCVYVGVCI